MQFVKGFQIRKAPTVLRANPACPGNHQSDSESTSLCYETALAATKEPRIPWSSESRQWDVRGRELEEHKYSVAFPSKELLRLQWSLDQRIPKQTCLYIAFLSTFPAALPLQINAAVLQERSSGNHETRPSLLVDRADVICFGRMLSKK